MIEDLFSTRHWALEVEVEPTNRCNGRCTICPETRRGPLTEMTVAMFEALVSAYVRYRDQVPLNQVSRQPAWPRITFSGSGEPLLNADLEVFVEIAVKHGFETRLITNGSLLTPQRAAAVRRAGLSRVDVSFIGIGPDEYQRSMGLDFDQSYGNVMRLRHLNMPFRVTYSAASSLSSSDEQIHAFWRERGVAVSGPHSVWNRGGSLRDLPNQTRAQDSVREVTFDIPAWCLRLKYNDTICANGDYVLCCCDYFSAGSSLGAVGCQPLTEIHARYEECLRLPPELCQRCVRSHTFASYAQDIGAFLKDAGCWL